MPSANTLNLWKIAENLADPYPLIRPFLFLLDPEDAHTLTLKMLGYGMGPQFFGPDDPILKTELMGLTFPNPTVLAAGMDKQATRIDEFMGFGFGSIEIGTVTPKPQPGNPRPRMFRISKYKGLINRFGFNSVGADMFAERLTAWRARPDRTTHPVGANIGKNKDTENDLDDYIACFKKLAHLVDYVVINISSPNTPGLRELQARQRMADLLKAVTDLRDTMQPALPVLVKIAPDLTEAQEDDIAAVVLDSKLQGLIISNTTLARPDVVPENLAKEAGGLSGPLLMEPSTRLLARMYKKTEGKIPLIGSGGINNGMDAYRKIRAGASLVQIYTALVYEGPMVIQKIKKELAALLRRDGYASVADAVGADH